MLNDYGSVGGAAHYVNNLSVELKKMGHNVLFVASNQYDRKIPMNDESFKSIKGGSVEKAITRLWNMNSQEKIKLQIQEFKPDVLHIHCFADQISPSIVSIIPVGLPVVLTVHDAGLVLDKDKGLVKRLYGVVRHKLIKKLLNRVDVFISPSFFMNDELAKLGFHARVINNGVPNKPTYTKPKNHNLLYVGRVDEDKGVLYAVMALDELRIPYPDITLTIVGDGSDLNRIKGYVAMRKLEKNVLFAGHVESSKLEKYYKDCGIVLVPSVCQDNQPTTIIEAKMYGRAVIASNVGGVSELISNGSNGVLVPPQSHYAIVEAVDYLIQKKAYTIMGHLGFKEASKYSMKTNAQKVQKIYNELLKVKKQ